MFNELYLITHDAKCKTSLMQDDVEHKKQWHMSVCNIEQHELY